MTEPSIDLDKPNAMGTLDRLTTNVAISLLAVVPTFFTCIFTPWRVSALLKQDDPEGRSGMLLAPGAFFPLSLLISMMLGAMLTTPEIANNNGSFLGPRLALSIQSAVSEGDVWRTIATIIPIYGFAILVGALGVILKPLAHPDWTLRVSLRAVFYVTGVFVSWIILSTAAIDLIRVTTNDRDLVGAIMGFIPIPSFIAMLWIYVWFFRDDGRTPWYRAGLLSVAMIVFKFLVVIALGMLTGV